MVYVKCKHCGDLFDKVFKESLCNDCQDLEAIIAKTADWKNEKHVPIIEKTENGIKVTVGSTLHPMVADHWIQMIEVIHKNKLYRTYLNPGDDPIAEFPINDVNVLAREYCNKHGLWANK
ncbi:MAG: desulfoferrodoxin family protein [Promethearchaeota archaeon]